MNELVTDLKSIELETLSNLKLSKANNTIRAYKSDFKDFSNFCAKNGFRSLPSEPKIVSLYLTYLSSSSKISTLKRRIASISVIHRLKGLYIDTKHPIIIENLMGIRRKIGSYQKSKKPILINELKEIVNAINDVNSRKNKLDDERTARDKAIILTGFAGGFRRSELVSINYEDLEFVTEGVKIFIRRSKTDQSGEGMIKALPYFENKNFCPVTWLKKWLEISKIKTGLIFNISDKSVALLVKKYASIAGLDSSVYSGHSLRSGFATVSAEFGADERSIMTMTGHKTTQMVRRYIQEANLFKNNALNKIKI
jgi:site-specific recombinase XerD